MECGDDDAMISIPRSSDEVVRRWLFSSMKGKILKCVMNHQKHNHRKDINMDEDNKRKDLRAPDAPPVLALSGFALKCSLIK